jgi:hypothetical protein
MHPRNLKIVDSAKDGPFEVKIMKMRLQQQLCQPK